MGIDLMRDVWAQLGALGLLIILLILTVSITWKQIKSLQEHHDARLKEVSETHRDERESWRKESNTLTEKVSRVIDENTKVLTELVTLVKRINGNN